jgi:predicted small lipoprotein YifL
MRTVSTISVLALAVLGLAACGKQGDLERPGPLWGPDARARAAAARSEQTTPRQPERRSQQQDNSSPVTSTPDNPLPVIGRGPGGTLPIEGDRPDPSGAPPSGSLPDPYNDPRR